MSVVKEITMPAPLSRFAGTPREFLQHLAYDASPRGQRHARGDHALMSRLHDLLGEDGLLTSLTDGQAEDAVEQAEEGKWEGWSLAGDEDDPILQRLDQHFAPAQARRVEYLTQRHAGEARRVAAQKQAHLDALRRGIQTAELTITKIQGDVKTLRAELDACAEELGVPAWS